VVPMMEFSIPGHIKALICNTEFSSFFPTCSVFPGPVLVAHSNTLFYDTMFLITRIRAALFLLAVVIPLVTSTATGGSKSCTKKEFWFVIFYPYFFFVANMTPAGPLRMGAAYRLAGPQRPLLHLRKVPIALLPVITGGQSKVVVSLGILLPLKAHPPNAQRVGHGSRRSANVSKFLPLLPHLPRLLRSTMDMVEATETTTVVPTTTTVLAVTSTNVDLPISNLAPLTFAPPALMRAQSLVLREETMNALTQ
jgi:hypothetical protein